MKKITKLLNSNVLNQHPWDWISHGVIAFIIWVPFAVLGYPYIGGGIAGGLFYGREQAQREADLGQIHSWNFFKWKMDSKIDFVVPAIVVIIASLSLEYFR